MSDMMPVSNDMFMQVAKKICAKWVNENVSKVYKDELDIIDKDMYVVWFSKTLQNWKALLSFDGPRSHGWYFEVTANGDKNEVYLDAYKKQDNQCINLEDYGIVGH